MKKFTLILTGMVLTVSLYGQEIRNSPHSKADLLRQTEDQNIQLPAKVGNTFMNPEDLGNPPDKNWISQFGGDGADVGQDIITDASGNSYVTGYFSGPVNFGTVLLTSVGYTDGFLAKFNSTGNLIWIRQLSCEPFSIVRSNGITIDQQGYIYITGSFTGQVLQIGTYSLGKVGTEDLFVAKYDSSGMPVLAIHDHNGGTMQGISIAVDAAGSCFVISGIVNSYSGGNYFSKYDQNGYLQWDYYNGANFTDIKFNGLNDLYLTGFIDSEVTFGNTTLTISGYGYAPFLVKCNTTGSFAWAIQGVPIQLEGYESINGASSLVIDGNQNIYFSGRFREKLVFGSDTLTNDPWLNYAPYLVKCTSAGSFVWARQGVVTTNAYSGTSYAYPVHVALDPTGNPLITCDLLNDNIAFGNIMVGGSEWAMVKYDNSGNAQWAVQKEGSLKGISGTAGNRFTYTGSAGGNIMIAQTEASATEEWSIVTSGNSGTAKALSLETDSQGNLLVYGKTDVPDPLFGNTTGIFIAKMKPDGDTIWSIPFFGGYSNTGYGSFVTVDQDDNVCVMGNFTDTLQIGNEILINTGYFKALFIAKFNSTGNLVWLRHIGNGDSNIDEYSITNDNQNNVIASGIFYNSLTIGTYLLTDAGNGDAFMAKFDENGNVSWAKRAGGGDIEYASYVSTDGSDNIYLTGEFYSRSITIGTQTVNLTNYDGDVVLIKFTPSGQMTWFQAYGGGAVDTMRRYYCWPNAISTDASGNSYIYGWTSKSNRYGTFLLESPYTFNFSLIKTNSSGTVQWAKIIKEKRSGWHSMQIDIDGQGNCYIGGNIRDTIYFENNRVVKQGYSDLFLAKYGNTGNFIWAKIFSSNPLEQSGIPFATNYLYGIAVYDTASLFIAGNSTYDLEVDDVILHSSNTNGFISLLGEDIQAGLRPLEKTETRLTVYPNPAEDNIAVSFSDPGSSKKTGTSIEIINLSGQILVHKDFDPGSTKILVGIKGLSPGMYFIKLKTGNEIKTGKFIKR